MTFFTANKRINLALQGGGAHGAFTWGALDRLLEDGRIEIGWVSGTSAGAINAAALASGLVRKGTARPRDAAREVLAKVWAAVESAGVPDLVRLNPFFYGLAKATSMSGMGARLSPYEFNPLGFDPLRTLLEANIDFDAIRATPGPELLIAATDAGTGQSRLFRRRELSVEALLASACLPQMHHAVEIDGRAYWDGGYSANPDVVTLAGESPIADTLIVQLNPLDRVTRPRSGRDIADQINAVTFNTPLLREIATVVGAQREFGRAQLFARKGALARLGRHRFHVLDGARHTAQLSADSKAKPERALLAFLFEAGRGEMTRWLGAHFGDIGQRQSVDLNAFYLSPRGRLPLPAADDPAPDDPDEALAEATGKRL
jgi:NTE family protein